MKKNVTKIFHRLHRQTNSVGKAAFIVALAGIMSRLLGLVRDRILASTFGAGDTLDVYNAAFRLPDLLLELVVLGALGAAFIPVFTNFTENKNHERAWNCAFGVLTFLLIGISFFSLVLFLFSPVLLHFTVPGFPAEKLDLTVQFTRIMLLSPFFLGVSAIFGGILMSYRRFVFYALAPSFYNIGIITGAIVFVPVWGPIGLAWGAVFGAFLHMLSHLPALAHRAKGVTWSFAHLAITPDIKKVATLMVPRILASTSNQISLFVMTFFASTLAAGSLTVITFAGNVQGVVLGLIGIPFAVAAFPTLSAYIAKSQEKQFCKLFGRTFRRILFYVLPLSILLILLRAQIVRVIYGGGQFDWQDTILTFQVLGILAVSLFAQSTIPLLARAFFALHDTRRPLYAALFSQLVMILFIVFFIRSLDIYALAIGFSLSAIVNMLLLLFLLRKKIAVFAHHDFFDTLIKILVATAGAALVAQSVKYIMAAIIGTIDTFFTVFAQLVISFGAGLGAYLVIAYFLQLDEVETLRNRMLIKIFGRSSVAAEEQNDVK